MPDTQRGEPVRVRQSSLTEHDTPTGRGVRTVNIYSVTSYQEEISIDAESVGNFEQVTQASVFIVGLLRINTSDLIIEGVKTGRAMAIIPAGCGCTPKAMSVVGDWFISPVVSLAKHVLAEHAGRGDPLAVHAEAVLREANGGHQHREIPSG